MALKEFVDNAMAAVADLRSGPLLPNTEDFARTLVNRSTTKAVNDAAVAAAIAHDYIRREPIRDLAQPTAGRSLTEKSLVQTGIPQLLLSGDAVDSESLVADLAGYLAGPVTPIWDYVIIDAYMRLSKPVSIVDGWELTTLATHELAQLVGLPSTARHVPASLSFDIDMYGGLAMLRRIDPEAEPHDDLLIYFGVRPTHALWEPMLALSLYQNAVVQLWAQYVIEPARRVDVLFDRVHTEPWIPDGVTELERVRHGDYDVDHTTEDRFQRFCRLLAPLLRTVAQPTDSIKSSRKRAAKLRRVAEHFLTAGEGALGEGDVLSEFNADATLHYVIALEAVLTSDEENKSDLARKVTQRASILAGTDDSDRVVVADTVREAYNVRSRYTHGDAPTEIDLPKLRRVLRDCILARLILGDPPQGYKHLADLADRALLDHACLFERVHAPISAFWTEVDLS